MTSHPIYPQLDPTPKTPATFSRALIYDFLRKKTGYKGVIFTDDLEMGAITQLCPIGEAAVRSAHAGHDMILVCHRMDVQKQAHRALVDAYRAGQLATKELEESVQRVATLQGRRTERFAPPPATEARAQREREETAALVRSICDQSVTVLKEGPAPRPGVATLAIYPRAGAVAARVLVENEFLDDSWLAAQLTAMGVPVIAHPVDMSPTAEQIQSACQAAGAAEQTILFLYDALADPTNRELLEAVQSSARALTVVLLRDVYDQSLVRDGVLCLTNYGVRVCDAQAVLRKLFSPANIAV